MAGCREGVICLKSHEAVNTGVQEHIIVITTSCTHVLRCAMVQVHFLQQEGEENNLVNSKRVVFTFTAII